MDVSRTLDLGEVGDWRIQVISGGSFRTDGGAMFGVVPQGMWSRLIAPDSDNLIPQQTNCLLLQSPDRVVIIDTGYGGKLPEKQRRWMHAEDGDPLFNSLAQAGVRPEDVTDVVFSHLHYDHCGGASIHVEANLEAVGKDDGKEEGKVRVVEAVPAFPLATHYVQRREWELAHDRSPELRGAYPRQNIDALEDVKWEWADGAEKILPSVHVLPSPGHTAGHQCVVIQDRDRAVVYLGDLAPTTHHFPILWCMAYDVDLLQTRRSKQSILSRAVEEDWTVVLNHDALTPAAKVRRDDRKGFALDAVALQWDVSSP